MRTATTLGRTKDGWQLISGPEVAADKQRSRYNDVAAAWPDGILEVRFQLNDGTVKSRTREKFETIQKQTKDAGKRAAEKVELAKLNEEKAQLAEKEEADKKAKLEADQRAREVREKNAAKGRK